MNFLLTLAIVIFGCPSCVFNNCFKGHLLNYWLDYVALLNNCSNGSSPLHEISNNVVCATSKASDQPAHIRSLI